MRTLSLAVLLCLALCTPAFAGYINGPPNGTLDAYYIDTYAVTDSFTGSGSMTGFTFADWVTAGTNPLTVDWSVGTSPFGSDVGSETNASLYSQNLFCSVGQNLGYGICGGGHPYDVYNVTVQTGNLSLTAGTTYWLTLTNATDNFGGRDGWDINSGPSLAYSSCTGSNCKVALQGEIPSESFTINGGSTGTTPEPSSFILVSSGVLGFAGILRRLRR